MHWRGKKHTEYIIPKLSTACYVMSSVKPYMSHNSLMIIYYPYFHSIMNYGLLFWGSSSYGIRVFRLQKYIIRIILGCKSRDSFRNLCKELKILPLLSQYVYTHTHTHKFCKVDLNLNLKQLWKIFYIHIHFILSMNIFIHIVIKVL